MSSPPLSFSFFLFLFLLLFPSTITKSYFSICFTVSSPFLPFTLTLFQNFVIPLRAKRVGEFIEIRTKKNFTHPYTEYPWVSLTLWLCHSVAIFFVKLTLLNIFDQNFFRIGPFWAVWQQPVFTNGPLCHKNDPHLN